MDIRASSVRGLGLGTAGLGLRVVGRHPRAVDCIFSTLGWSPNPGALTVSARFSLQFLFPHPSHDLFFTTLVMHPYPV